MGSGNPTQLAARTAASNRERRRSIREEVSTSRSSPPASARTARDPEIDVAARPSAQPYPLPNHACLAAATRPNSRPELQPLTGKGEEVSGRRSIQAAPRRLRAPAQHGTQRSTSRRAPSAPLPYPLPNHACLAAATRPNSRPELRPLTGKGEEVSGRRSIQAAPRRARAPAQQEPSGRRLIAPQRTAYPLPGRSRLSAATNQIRGLNCNL